MFGEKISNMHVNHSLYNLVDKTGLQERLLITVQACMINAATRIDCHIVCQHWTHIHHHQENLSTNQYISLSRRTYVFKLIAQIDTTCTRIDDM